LELNENKVCRLIAIFVMFEDENYGTGYFD
jgi:hypothetical protein